MRSSTHGSHLVKLTRLGAFNCYLVRETDGLTLIDTNLSGSARAILAAAAGLGAPIVRIALTHAHDDHVASLDALHALLPEAEVLISARDARFLAGERTLDPDEEVGALRGGFRTCATRPTRPLRPGERVGSLEVLASPGHTPGHLAFLDTRDGTLIAGDALSSQGGVGVAGTLVPWFPVSPFATWHRPTALRSARELRAARPSRLALGHGPVLEPALEAMDRAIEVAAREVEQAAASGRA